MNTYTLYRKEKDRPREKLGRYETAEEGCRAIETHKRENDEAQYILKEERHDRGRV